MKKIVIVFLCAALLISLPFTSLAVSPKPLVPDNRVGVPTPDNGDPDGPTEGRLDDPTDWKYLGKAFIYYMLTATDSLALMVCFFGFPDNITDDIDDILENLTLEEQLVFVLLYTTFFGELAICGACLIEAFDIRDLDGDGC